MAFELHPRSTELRLQPARQTWRFQRIIDWTQPHRRTQSCAAVLIGNLFGLLEAWLTHCAALQCNGAVKPSPSGKFTGLAHKSRARQVWKSQSAVYVLHVCVMVLKRL